ncbi:helix-turn-helix transcriptional regulator [Micromonospora eburnea]|uniref:Regulatory protein, luxR family n=1 Tax=Micromonospora eburnea TaxID=227316 RepID=A0A1C6UZ78_9ACTN|nr:AAA family ATPase [Micromonospora eburnea]SCL59336.1 regulatory protein, luxR family [Micromonospora eburnea]
MLLAERMTEITILEELLAACRARVGQFAVISGPVGCGKTEVLDAFAEEAMRSGAIVFGATAKRSGADVPFDVLVQLFCGSAAPERLRRQMDHLVDATSTAGAEGAAARTHVLRVIFTELVALADAQPVVIMVDDVECADHESLRELLDLVSRLRRAQALVVLSLSDEENAGTAMVHAELLRHRRWRRIELSLLSVEGVEALISAQPARWPDAPAAEIHRLSGGNPLLVRALLNDLGGADPQEPGTAFGQALLACLHRSSPETLAVARGIAVLDRPAGDFLLAELVGIEGQRVQAALRRLESAGLLSAGEFRNPASRTVILSDTAAPERRKLHERAAELLYLQGASASTVARHLIEIGEAPRRWTQRLLREAAELATVTDDLDFASDCLDLALRSSPDDQERATALVRLAGVVWRRNPVAVVRHLPALIESSRRGLLSGRQACGVARSLVWHGLTGEAVEVLEAAGRTGRASDSQIRAETGLIRRWLRSWHPPLAEKVYGAQQSPEAMDVGVVADERFVSTALLSEVLTCGGKSDVPRRAEEILRGIDLDETTLEPAESALLALLYSDHTERALTWCEPLLAAASERYAPTWTARLEAVRAEIALHQGDLSKAAGYARAALDRIASRGWGVAVGAPLATLIQAATMTGDHETAGAYVKTPVPQEMFKTRFGLRYLCARGLHLAASGRLHAALSDLLTCGSLAAEWGMDVPSFIPWRTAAAEVYLKLGDRERGRKMAEAQLIRVNKGQLRTRGISLRAMATTGELRGRLHLLRESVDLLHSAGDRYELATALAELHRAHRAMGERQRANAVFQQALRLATECRAEPLRRSLLRESSDEHAESLVMKEPNGGLVRLSRAERRVTALAATGHTNREIAQKLYITVSTVEQHLTKAYRKLNVSNRADLAAACMSSFADSA